MSEKVFVNGFIFKLPSEKAPSFVKGSISIKIADFTQWVKEHKDGEWLNIDLKESKNGTGYAELNTYKKEQKSEGIDPLPF